jgi:hypothetical protein
MTSYLPDMQRQAGRHILVRRVDAQTSPFRVYTPVDHGCCNLLNLKANFKFSRLWHIEIFDSQVLLRVSAQYTAMLLNTPYLHIFY